MWLTLLTKYDMYYFCLGPLEETIEDFWRMIWEMKTFTVVMLTDLKERGRVRLNDYICLLLSFLFLQRQKMSCVY